MRRHRLPLAFLALALSAATASAQAPNRFLAGIWPDELIVFDQETLTFETIGALRHGAATNQNESADGRFFTFVTGRMEAVEIFDVAEMAVVDEFRLSTDTERVRFMSATPSPDGSRIFVVPIVVELHPDRFVHATPSEIWVYDRTRREVTGRVALGDADDWRPNIHFSPDGSSVFFVNDDLVELDAETLEEKRRVSLGTPLAPGYGGVRGHSLNVIEPGRLFGTYRTTEPRQGMDLFGVLEIQLPEMTFTHYEVGPGMQMNQFALSPDGKRGYAGLNDAAVLDMETKEVVLRRKGFERGRTNTSMIVSADGKRLFISGVGDTMYVHDAETLERETEVFAGGDFMIAPREIRYRGESPAGDR